MKPDISFVYLSNRPGGIDLLGTSLAGELPNLDDVSPELRDQFKDEKVRWELVVIDDYPGRVERGEAAKYLAHFGLPLSYYGVSKPKYYRDSRQGLANAMNTGLIVARGDYVVFVHDYSFVPSWAPAAWNYSFREHQKCLLHGIGMIFVSDPPPVADDIYTWDHLNLVQERMWFPEKFELFYMGMPMKFAEKIGGMDERGDYCGYFNLESLARQASILDYQLKVLTGLYCWQVDHRMWGHPAARLNTDQRMFDTMWKGWGDITSICTMPFWTVPSANGFIFEEERAKVNKAREEKSNESRNDRPG